MKTLIKTGIAVVCLLAVTTISAQEDPAKGMKPRGPVQTVEKPAAKEKAAKEKAKSAEKKTPAPKKITTN